MAEEDGALVALEWGWGSSMASSPLLAATVERLHAYFDGAPVDFADLPVRFDTSAYRRRVWEALRRIPRGRTATYGDLARLAGGSPRSIGGANAANPLPIIVPCHRVVATAGLGGYSGGEGIATKRFLLDLEAASSPAPSLFTAPGLLLAPQTTTEPI